MDQDIKSRPRYRPLELDPLGRRHLMLCDLATVPPDALADPASFAVAETWTVGAAEMIVALQARLAEEAIGLRLYAVGTEGFLWDVAAVARQAGMGQGEVFLCHAGSLRRRVQCVHCKSMIANVTTNLVDCPGCGAKLFVRDHFSARLAAFMAVQVDAEAPGDWPTLEEYYR